MKPPLAGRATQAALILVLLDGPYRAFVARRSVHNPRKDLSQEEATSNFDEIPFYIVYAGPSENPHERYSSFDLLPFYKATSSPNDKHGQGATSSEVNLPEGTIHAPFFPFRLPAKVSGINVKIPRNGDSPTPTSSEETWVVGPLLESHAKLLSQAVEDQWECQGVLSGLPVWAKFGEMMRNETGNLLQPHINTKHTLEVLYNRESRRVVKVDLIAARNGVKKVQTGSSYNFSFAITLAETEIPWENRWDRYHIDDYPYFEARPVQWFDNLLTTILVLVLYRTQKSSRSTGGNLRYERGLHVTLLSSVENRDDAHDDVFREPPMLPLLAGLVGAGIQLLVVLWMVLWFDSVRCFSPFLLEPSNLEFLSMLISRVAFFFVFAGFVSAKIVLEYASSTNVQEHVLETFHDELELTSNIETDSTDGLEEGTNDDVIYLSAMMRRAMSWVLTWVVGFHVLLVATFTILCKLRGTYTLKAVSSDVLYMIIGLGVLGVPSCLAGILTARRQTLRNPQRCTASRLLLPKYDETCITLLLSGAVNYLPIFTECRFIFTCVFGYKYYKVSLQTWVALFLWVTCIVVSTKICLSFGIKTRTRQDWQWMAFGSGAAISSFNSPLAISRFWGSKWGHQLSLRASYCPHTLSKICRVIELHHVTSASIVCLQILLQRPGFHWAATFAFAIPPSATTFSRSRLSARLQGCAPFKWSLQICRLKSSKCRGSLDVRDRQLLGDKVTVLATFGSTTAHLPTFRRDELGRQREFAPRGVFLRKRKRPPIYSLARNVGTLQART
ncbi:endomembrane protein 70-domain containing protein [Nitzschia inconspicua]|uniref:Transmembrane 9 superfamily member n=1 Tax=Nitzschia inconspicua TaxID=303405 RepID=A0A9K3KWB7_9STRA|nr:endomembrane protein 70-domain containing protein [Nitzschia inconspicua]